MNKKFLQYLFVVSIPAITLILWFIDTGKDGFILPQLAPTYLAEIIGVIALSLMAVNFTLASRIHFIDKLFGGLDKSFKMHKFTGKLAFYLIIFHPVLYTLNSFRGIQTILLYFVPGNVFEYTLGMIAYYSLISLVLLTIVFKLPYNIWKITHRLMIVPLIFAGIHAILNNPFGILPYRGWLFFITILGVVMYLYKEIWYEYIGPRYFYKLKAVNHLGSVTEMYLEPASEKKVKFVPGQFLFLSFQNNPKITPESHPFSMASSPDNDVIRFAAKASGDYTQTLINANPGDLIKLTGPHGFFNNRPITSDQIWIAGGIGITPFLAMLDYEANHYDPTDQHKITFIYSTKNEAEAIYQAEVIEKCKKAQHIKPIFHFSDTQGYLNADIVKSFSGYDNLKNKEIYLCGPMVMMKGLETGFKAMGVEESSIIFEDFTLR